MRFWVLGALVLVLFIVGLVAPAGALAGGLKVDFAAAAPASYDHGTGVGGVWGDTVKSLAPAKHEFACGHRVVFFARLSGLSAADNPVVLDFKFDGQPTSNGNPGAGFSKILSASANTGDPANVNMGKPVVSIDKQAGGHPSPDLTGTIRITGLGSGDFVLRLVVELACTPGSTPTGVIQARFISGSAGGKSINGGAQTIPLKIADLEIKQSETVAPSPTGGDTVDDHVVIVNPGPEATTDAVLHDTVPAGAVIDSATTDQGSCSTTGTEVTCVVPHIDPGGAVNVDVITSETTTDASEGSPSDATASGAGFDPFPASSAEEVPPPPSSSTEPADLAIDVVDTSATVPLDGLETEVITVINDGPGAATGVDITDALGAAAEVVDVKPGTASCASTTPLMCTIDTLPAGASETIDLEVRPLQPGQLIDAASVSDDQPNSQLAEDFATTDATVLPRDASPPAEADLATIQSETVAPSPTGGDTVDDHVVIIDHGPAAATDAVLHDTVPAGAVIDSATTDQGSCSTTGTEVTCVVPHIDPGGAVNVDVITSETTTDASEGSPSDATATAAQFDPKPANNSDNALVLPPSESGAPSEPADLAIDVVDTSATVPLDGLETEVITVINDGPGAATGVDITDALGAAAEVVDVKPGTASCASTTPLICTIDTLPAGASETIDLEVRPLQPGQLIDAASVSDDQPNSQLAEDFATTDATVKPRDTDARMRIVPVEPLANAGQVVEFVVIAGVTKPVPGVAPHICVTIPAGLRMTSAPGATATRSRACWRPSDLLSGRSQSFRFRARVGRVPRAGATFSIRGRLTGANFTAVRANTTVQVPPHAVACTSSFRPIPLGRIAC